MEPIIVIVGFLGAGKTRLLSYLIEQCLEGEWEPYVVLNDYENASLDAQLLTDRLPRRFVKALNGSCICCSGIHELRAIVNGIPERKRGITLIEANGTSDACSLMGFLGVGIDERFKPPVQISVVDVKNWQKRKSFTDDLFNTTESNNELEANQIQVSSLIVLNHLKSVLDERKKQVAEEICKLNPYAKVVLREELSVSLLSELELSTNVPSEINHQKTHWASCSIDLPHLSSFSCIKKICDALPPSILRVKGCTKIGAEDDYTYFERCPDGEVSIRTYTGEPTTGAKLLTVGPGSDPATLERVVAEV